MRRLIVFIVGLLGGIAAIAQPLPPEKVPEPLRPWIEWALYGQEQRACPRLYHNAEEHRCAWPGRLELELGERAGRFAQSWRADADSWVALPGGLEHWPQAVMIDDQPALVVERNGKPMLRIAPGEHRVQGEFAWDKLPRSLALPADSGLVTLAVNGAAVAFPTIAADGQLWLRAQDNAQAEAGNRLDIQVFRRVIDELPMRIITRIDLDVAGAQREEWLGKPVLEGFIPLSLSSPLPARLESDGRLRLQVRPGRWSIEIAARGLKDTTQVELAGAPAPWPESEVWVFDARNHLRLVEVEGATTVDPRQTTLPDDWRQLPAYRLQPGAALSLKVIRRGDPEPEPDQLSLQRHLWLDFDGRGYTLQDHVTGTTSRSRRLTAGADIALGRALVDGEPQFITTLPGSQQPGVEVRRGSIDLSADSRYQGPINIIPAVGWDHDFQQVGATLHLPPGWRLFAATGADNLPDTWLQRWTLLDLFLVLLTALVAAYLWGAAWGWRALIQPWAWITLFALALIWHESGAPRMAWLNLFAALALYKALPAGRLRRMVAVYRYASLIGLLLIALPFMIDQVRLGLYPQLEYAWQTVGSDGTATGGVGMALPQALPPAAVVNAPPAVQQAGDEKNASVVERALNDSIEQVQSASKSDYGESKAARKKRYQIEQIDPKANVQTGPGLPNWRWNEVSLSWNGPVAHDQGIRLWYLPPAVNLVLGFLRALLVALLALRMLGIARHGRQWRLQPALAALATALLLPALVITARPVQAADFPDPALLESLKQRLLAPPECFPDCAQMPRLRIETTPAVLSMRAEIHAVTTVAVPLPAHAEHWLPAEVMVDGVAATQFARAADGQLWLRMEPGVHQVVLSGPLPPRPSVQIPLALTPRRVEVAANGWRIDGVHEDGVADAQLQLTRIDTATTDPAATLEPTALPPFARVERTLRLGLDWRVETEVFRVSPADSALVLEVPLLAGESVTTEGVRVQNGRVLVNLPPQQASATWESVLEKRTDIPLTAPDAAGWTEVWRADISPIWHAELSGLAVIHHQDSAGRWLPEWWPWPGETVTLALSRPQGVAGQTLTIDSSRMAVRPGSRATDTTLDLGIRSSLGGQQTLTLPEGASLQSVAINGAPQPIRQDGRKVTLPIVPGAQAVRLVWREDRGIEARFRTPPVDLGAPSVNSQLNVGLGMDRWLLWASGPRLGPAVLFWGVLLVTVIIAVGLGRVRITPLGTGQWLLLGIGLSQLPAYASVAVVGWLIALGLRARFPAEFPKIGFNLVQLALAALSLAALAFLFAAIEQGLLGQPDMQIAGNGSSAYELNWFQDRSAAELPRATLVTAPLFVYRLLMLAWALWLAFALLRWLRWGWSCMATHGLWKSFSLRGSATPSAVAVETAEPPASA